MDSLSDCKRNPSDFGGMEHSYIGVVFESRDATSRINRFVDDVAGRWRIVIVAATGAILNFCVQTNRI